MHFKWTDSFNLNGDKCRQIFGDIITPKVSGNSHGKEGKNTGLGFMDNFSFITDYTAVATAKMVSIFCWYTV